MTQMLDIEITFLFHKDAAPQTSRVTVRAMEWEQACRLELDDRLDYIYRLCGLANLRPYHYKVRKIDIRLLGTTG